MYIHYDLLVKYLQIKQWPSGFRVGFFQEEHFLKKQVIFLFCLIFSQSFFQQSFSQVEVPETYVHYHDREDTGGVLDQRIILQRTQILPFFYPLLKSVKRMGMPVRYLIQSLLLLDQVSFVQFKNEDIKGTYNKITNTMRLGDDFLNELSLSPYGEDFIIKPIENLSKVQITTLYHELWHVLLERHVKRNRPLFFHLYHQQLAQYYKGEIFGGVYQNEAYGVYIDQVILNYLNHYERFKKSSPEVRQKLRESPDMRRNFFQANNLPAYGYRYSLFERAVVFSDVNLSIEDRGLIYQYVFKDEISIHLYENFKEELFK